MPDLPTTSAARLPRARWLDPRLLLGALLVVVSMLVGARVVAGADDSVAVWALRSDLAAGAVLAPSDLVVEHVQLLRSAPAYVLSSTPVVGRTLGASASGGELLARRALDVGTADQVEVSVPVRGGHFPADLERNDQVDVYLTPDVSTRGTAEAQQQSLARPRLVLAAVTVADVRRADGRLGVSSAGETGIVLTLPRGAAARAGDATETDPVVGLVAAFHSGAVDLVRVAEGRS